MQGLLLFTTPALMKTMKGMPAYADAKFHNVSSGGYEVFSPFHVSEVPIPVPGQPGITSKTVEGIWQGLKIIDGTTDFDLFSTTRVRKRRHEPYAETRFLYGETSIDLIEARHHIYVPAYAFYFNNGIPRRFIDDILEDCRRGIPQYFYDVDANPDINNPEDSYSHASLLVDLLRREHDQPSSR